MVLSWRHEHKQKSQEKETLQTCKYFRQAIVSRDINFC